MCPCRRRVTFVEGVPDTGTSRIESKAPTDTAQTVKFEPWIIIVSFFKGGRPRIGQDTEPASCGL